MFSPHHVNQGGVQKFTPQVTLYETHTSEGVSQSETQKWQEQSGTVGPSGPSEGILARVTSTTSEGLCQGAPDALVLSCRDLVRTL